MDCTLSKTQISNHPVGPLLLYRVQTSYPIFVMLWCRLTSEWSTNCPVRLPYRSQWITMNIGNENCICKEQLVLAWRLHVNNGLTHCQMGEVPSNYLAPWKVPVPVLMSCSSTPLFLLFNECNSPVYIGLLWSRMRRATGVRKNSCCRNVLTRESNRTPVASVFKENRLAKTAWTQFQCHASALAAKQGIRYCHTCGFIQ